LPTGLFGRTCPWGLAGTGAAVEKRLTNRSFQNAWKRRSRGTKLFYRPKRRPVPGVQPARLKPCPVRAPSAQMELDFETADEMFERLFPLED
jgi:hypothetical protein